MAKVVILTGAGISAESGIPTFRGQEGYWTVGSVHYHPQEMATQDAFTRMPDEVWRWYLYRLGVCRGAVPNAAHDAVAAAEARLGDAFVLITQNVDGLHIRAGNSLERTYQIHGNIDYMRCSADCTRDLVAIPEALHGFAREQPLTAEHKAKLQCHRCGARTRPHVLWFDECYDEEYYRLHSSLTAARSTRVLIVVGTSASTNLPNQVVSTAAAQGATVIDINTDDNPFAEIAETTPGGRAIRASATEALPEVLGDVFTRQLA